MPRTFTVTKKTSFDALCKTMLDARVKDAQAETALNDLKEANPHLAGELEVGTVVIVPDTAGVKPSAGEPATKALRENLQVLAEKALEDTAASLRARLEARVAERTELAKAFKSQAFTSAAKGNPAAAQFKAAAEALANEEKADNAARARLAAMSSAARLAFARLDKLGS
jgi:hypothetical protein